jgi:hypothetical protein
MSKQLDSGSGTEWFSLKQCSESRSFRWQAVPIRILGSESQDADPDPSPPLEVMLIFKGNFFQFYIKLSFYQ